MSFRPFIVVQLLTSFSLILAHSLCFHFYLSLGRPRLLAGLVESEKEKKIVKFLAREKTRRRSKRNEILLLSLSAGYDGIKKD